MIKDIKAFCGYCEFAENCEKHYFECDKHKVLAEIATDQRKIDIEKACEWFETQISRGKGASCRVFFIDSVERFRKAMEKE